MRDLVNLTDRAMRVSICVRREDIDDPLIIVDSVVGYSGFYVSLPAAILVSLAVKMEVLILST